MIPRREPQLTSTPRPGNPTMAAVAVGVGLAWALTSCGSDAASTSDTSSASATAGVDDDASRVDDSAFAERLDAIQTAVTSWADAGTTEDATTAAETAANLVVGPGGPGYGDRNGDGVVSGENDAGLLSGVDGSPEGIAVALADVDCVTRDVLGATADDVAAGWAEMEEAIAAWTPSGNTMPSLASHPMRVVGWATFTIASESLDDAHEYAGHAQLHVDVSLDALDC